MYIKSITIDGFKSYARRTEVTDFDPQFNAITGLNGSGKSNILDAMCFLLGISTLSQMRVTNLHELVYKSGHAGVNKASVCITFDNRLKKDSPPGYENYDEIVVSRQVLTAGRNRYLINGVNATNTRVLDMFASVRLNINNPNFLIMQGRITKVLNMKPVEILSLIEEAVGTSLYESKRAQAHKTIDKKETKLSDINNLIKSDIEPLVYKLNKERSSYSEYQQVVRELERLKMITVAVNYKAKTELVEEYRKKISDFETRIKESKTRAKEIEKEIKKLEDKIAKIKEQNEIENSDGLLGELEAKLDEKMRAHAKLSAYHNSRKEQILSEEHKLSELETLMQSEEDTRIERKQKLKEAEDQNACLMEESVALNKKVMEAKAYFSALSSGVDSDARGNSLQQQLIESKKAVSNLETQIRQTELSSTHTESTLNKRREELKITEDDGSPILEEIERKNERLETMKGELCKISEKYRQNDRNEANLQKERLITEIAKASHNVANFQSRSFVFNYNKPFEGFDSKHKVYGIVANLIKPKNTEMITAIEVAAGSRLFNVIVDTEETAKLLLKSGKLQSRVTFIPLNKIIPNCISPTVLGNAKRLGGENNVDLVLSCVEYERSLEKAMQFVFGTTLVCKDLTTARAVVFDRSVSKRAVTFDGDLVEPSGSLTGGSRNRSESALARLMKLREAEYQVKSKQTELANLEIRIGELKVNENRAEELRKSMELVESEVSVLRTRLEQSDYYSLTRECSQLEESLKENSTKLTALTKACKEAGLLVDSINKKLSLIATGGGNLQIEAEDSMKRFQIQWEEMESRVRESNKAIECLKMDVSYSAEEIKSIQVRIDVILRSLEQKRKELGTSSTAYFEAEKEEKEIERNLLEEKERIKSMRGNITECNEQLKIKVENKRDIELGYEQMIVSCSRSKDNLHKETEQMEAMIDKNRWIIDERNKFGLPDGPFDFSKLLKGEKAEARVAELEAIRDNLCLKVNMRALAMFESVENKYGELMERRDILLSDRQKIHKGIGMMDVKKKETLKLAFDQVNKDFGAIFSSILPTAKARLVPHNEEDLSQGVEFRVGFGDIWKESLTELSGGQKSLVALSLILSLLRFNPAPIYILDEIDAALDLSHTQNIGKMIRKYFKNSQFIIVSLQESMFNNANVLFRTKFIEGVSTVTRYKQLESSERDDSNRVETL